MRGNLPIGVSIDKETGFYKAQIMHNGKKVYLGLYQCPHIASMAWLSRKIEISREYADICNMISPELYSGLVNKIKTLHYDSLVSHG